MSTFSSSIPDAKGRLIGKDPDAGKDWGLEKEAKEDEMADRHEFEQTLRDSVAQGSQACYSPWVTKSRTKQHSFSVFWRLVSEPLLS